MPKAKTNEEIMAALRANQAYSHIDIERELQKADAWCMVNNRKNTPRFFVNWLNRIEEPLRPVRKDVVRELPADVEPPDNRCAVCGKEFCLSLHREDR